MKGKRGQDSIELNEDEVVVEDERDAAAEAIPEELDNDSVDTRDEDRATEDGVLSRIDLDDLDLESLGIDRSSIPHEGELMRRTVECDVRRNAEQNRTVVVINTAALDSYRTEIVPKGGDLKPYKKNPIVLINHDRFLVAGVSKVQLRKGEGEGALVATMEDSDWDLDDPAILPWYNKVKRGFVRAASIGFIPLIVKRMLIDPEGEDRWDNWKWVIEKWILKEWSWVSVPSNSEALVEQRQSELHIQKLESQITDLSRQVAALTGAIKNAYQVDDTSAIDARESSPERATVAGGEDVEDDADRSSAATPSASDRPSEPAAAPAKPERSQQLDANAIARAVQAALSPQTISTAVVAAVREMSEQRDRALGKA